MDLVGLCALGITAVMVVVIISIIPVMLAHKLITKKSWKESFRFGLWVVGANALAGFGMGLLGIELGVLATLLVGAGIFWAVANFKFKIDTKRTVYVYLLNIAISVLLVFVLLVGFLASLGVSTQALI